MSRRLLPFFFLAVLAVLTLAAITLSVKTDRAAHITAPHPSRVNPYGAASYGFGGYTVNQLTTEIGAQWHVPAIDPRSGNGAATTWIAVEDFQRQFIQLGTNENKNDGTAVYSIFWSDVAVSFHPQQLLEVAPGDLIKFKMVQVPRGWRLSFDDLTNNTPETITVPYGQGSSFFTAQWIQEDPTFNGLATHLPYPTVAAPTISDMTIDHKSPKLSSDESQVLSTINGVNLIPSKPTHNRFTFNDATGPARQYLNDVFAFNVALYPFQVDLFYNRSPSKSVMQQLLSTLTAVKTDFATQTWPVSTRPAVRDDVREVELYLKMYRAFSVAPAPLNMMELNRLGSLNRKDEPIANSLRRELGLPPI
jgi:hypothetical protein